MEEEKRFTRGRLTRGKGLRKTTGCATCRRRRVKCDELKPNCRKCIKSKQECTYSLPPPQRHQQHDIAIVNERSSKSPEISVVEENAQPSTASTIRDDSVSQEQSTYCVTTEAPEQTWGTINTSPYQNELFSTPINEPEFDTPLQIRSTWLTQREPSVAPDLSPESSHLNPNASSTIITHPTVLINSNIETATAKWLDLLIGDAAADDGLLPDLDPGSTSVDIFGNPIMHSPSSDANRRGSIGHSETSHASNPFLQERYIKLGGDQLLEKQAWHSKEPLKLLPQEKYLFQSFVRHISCWMDFFDPKKPFGTFVPRLALHNVGLMNAILCLAARYLSLKPSTTPCGIPESQLPCQNDAIQYYYKTLHYIQKAMQFDTYKTSLELLSTSLIVSAYEMLDGSSENWERHLKGVFWIQRSQVIHGDSKGLRQAVWWAWLCQDVWAAFREKRKPFTFWRPIRGLDELDPYELASRSVYLFAQAVGFCSREQQEEGKKDIKGRLHKADSILQMLEDWREHLTVEFEPLPTPSAQPNENFPAVWIHPPLFGVAMQVYYCSIILVSLERPILGGMGDHLELRKTLSKCIQMVCGIAKTQEDYESSIMSSQCLYIAGLSVENINERTQVLSLLLERQERCGWPTQSLGGDLSATWKILNRY
ncbi:fungal-specific transcription factor domain-containing protein, partial [Annulohypoxylon nitens]